MLSVRLVSSSDAVTVLVSESPYFFKLGDRSRGRGIVPSISAADGPLPGSLPGWLRFRLRIRNHTATAMIAASTTAMTAMPALKPAESVTELDDFD